MAKADNSSVQDLFRRLGHLQAGLDPLGVLPKVSVPELDSLSGSEAERLRRIYCGHAAAEFTHVHDPAQFAWLVDRFEASAPEPDRRRIQSRILRAEVFERFIHTRYVGSKRFSIEGLASLIPLLDTIVQRAAEREFDLIMIAMAHRGRLTVMWNIVNTPAQTIFAVFEDVDPHSAFGRGDVKYHRGATGAYPTVSGKVLRVRLASNPSHLEFANPVLLGRVRARQERLGDEQGKKCLSIMIHGDAALAGQGVTAETLNFANVPGFSVGGTIHIVANNLIGFTATPKSYQSTRYCTDIAKRLPIPIFHVNADEPDEVVRIGALAADYRFEFSNDVFVDLIGYRRFGHNEGDDPTFTAPVLYKKIQARADLYRDYGRRIGLSDEEIGKEERAVIDSLSEERELARSMERQPAFFSLPNYWEPYFGGAYSPEYEVDTAVSAGDLAETANGISSYPAGFHPHPKILKLLDQRREMGAGKRPVDWAGAEALAFGTLVREGIPVRLSGQDTRRGTFSQRHAVLFDVENESEYIPLQNISPGQAPFRIYDTVLSEQSVVGFEYGYSRDYPETLVCWEAQFGDFANGAQVIIDQFISAGEDKWDLLSGIVLLLPHGYEGAGPEHSSARLERFLQLCAEDNIQVAQPSSAAQYFHLLRRQVRRKWLKPLVVMTPKSMLRLPAAASPLREFTDGRFRLVIEDEARFDDAEKLLLCTGKIVHELRAEREKRGEHGVAIVSIEQLYPFPEEELAAVFAKHSAAKNICWVQEEPANMGALFFVREYLEQLTDRSKITAVRRSASASPATGSARAHEIEQQTLINLAFAKTRE